MLPSRRVLGQREDEPRYDKTINNSFLGITGPTIMGKLLI